ncbi:hypothetical protein [Paracidovorax anthurii]|uniref:hypothetical protein n=1 Tax=Paracidovorax anthurii TaxID=78229 RepID=UPI001474935E|nr:hypothetical protein [Paracidovorax anthurii]
MERSYIADTTPHRLARGARKPDAFLRYLKGEQVPWGTAAVRSPVRWALEHHSAFVRTFQSPLFELLQLGDDRDALINFSRDLYAQGRVSVELIHRSMGKSKLAAKRKIYVSLWSNPKDVLAVRHTAEPDALCLILIALKANAGRNHEHQCLTVCAEWLQSWVEQIGPHENLVMLMLQTLAERLPECKPLVENNAWRTLRVDLADPCFSPSFEETMREALIKSLLTPPIAKRERKSL